MSEKNYMLPVRNKWLWSEREQDTKGNLVGFKFAPLVEQLGMAHASQIWERVSQAARIAVGLTHQTGPRNPTEEHKERARQLADRLLQVIWEEGRDGNEEEVCWPIYNSGLPEKRKPCCQTLLEAKEPQEKKTREPQDAQSDDLGKEERMSMLAPIIKKYPNAKPLAMTIIEAAAAQGANSRELFHACEMAKTAYENAQDTSLRSLSEFESAAKVALGEL